MPAASAQRRTTAGSRAGLSRWRFLDARSRRIPVRRLQRRASYQTRKGRCSTLNGCLFLSLNQIGFEETCSSDHPRLIGNADARRGRPGRRPGRHGRNRPPDQCNAGVMKSVEFAANAPTMRIGVIPCVFSGSVCWHVTCSGRHPRWNTAASKRAATIALHSSDSSFSIARIPAATGVSVTAGRAAARSFAAGLTTAATPAGESTGRD
ncbi:hypothetical protein C6558_09390 [Ensifer sp. NM-2]|nr:hypothetical protein [Ensifer canadensis]PSS65571.1 hypothetical protein C6558_09390 [Ensifer sp. NM-2]